MEGSIAQSRFNSQSEPKKNHINSALSFELGKVETMAICEGHNLCHVISAIPKLTISRIHG